MNKAVHSTVFFSPSGDIDCCPKDARDDRAGNQVESSPAKPGDIEDAASVRIRAGAGDVNAVEVRDARDVPKVDTFGGTTADGEVLFGADTLLLGRMVPPTSPEAAEDTTVDEVVRRVHLEITRGQCKDVSPSIATEDATATFVGFTSTVVIVLRPRLGV